eukprot:sb/3470938/
MPAPKKRRDGPKQAKKAPPPPKVTMLQVKERYLEEMPPLPYHAYLDERCFLESHCRPAPYLSEEEWNGRVELEKDHARYMNLHCMEIRRRHRKQVHLRERALRHLQECEGELYSAAITFDFDQFPADYRGLKESPANPKHIPPLRVESVLLLNEEAVATNASVKVNVGEEYKKLKQKEKQSPSLEDSVAANVNL